MTPFAKPFADWCGFYNANLISVFMTFLAILAAAIVILMDRVGNDQMDPNLSVNDSLFFGLLFVLFFIKGMS